MIYGSMDGSESNVLPIESMPRTWRPARWLAMQQSTLACDYSRTHGTRIFINFYQSGIQRICSPKSETFHSEVILFSGTLTSRYLVFVKKTSSLVFPVSICQLPLHNLRGCRLLHMHGSQYSWQVMWRCCQCAPLPREPTCLAQYIPSTPSLSSCLVSSKIQQFVRFVRFGR